MKITRKTLRKRNYQKQSLVNYLVLSWSKQYGCWFQTWHVFKLLTIFRNQRGERFYQNFCQWWIITTLKLLNETHALVVYLTSRTIKDCIRHSFTKISNRRAWFRGRRSWVRRRWQSSTVCRCKPRTWKIGMNHSPRRRYRWRSGWRIRISA